ncbi:MAG TPA: hypothetical protein VK348_15870, partial [Planctomycetota bacterium]|nr:hypothetical protein [Planctomycetota bacterium]
MFGNTVYSASLVIAVFMLGLGAGSYIAGIWADRRYGSRPDSLLRTYGWFELVIALLGLGISALLPYLGQVSSLVTSYSREANGWYGLSTASYLARVGIAVVLLAPITLLMGGTLTLLIRHLVRSDLGAGGWRIAVLYAVNTAGAALGCFLTDVLLVPAYGFRDTQLVAVFFNLVAAAGAFFIARNVRLTNTDTGRKRKRSVRLQPDAQPSALSRLPSGAILLTSLALAMAGFAAMGMEILWFRHVSILLGGFRAVFSLLLTVILAGIGAGSLASGFLARRTDSPAQWWMLVQGSFVAATLLGLAVADAGAIELAVTADRAHHAVESRLVRTVTELWFNASPILLEAGLPALLMGFSFPLANAVIQRAERSVGRRAGVLYFSNTCGAVCGSLAAGFLFLPVLGIQGSATILAALAGLAVVPIYFAGADPRTRPANVGALAASMLLGVTAAGLWLLLPSAYVINRAVPPSNEQRPLTQREGLTEVITVMDVSGKGRTLFTNGHP